jgi:large subunit ribosomal protein L15
VLKYEPDHFGKDKFVPPTHREVKKWINVGQLDELAEKLQLKGRAKRKTLDLKSLGFEKLLGGGIVKGAYRVLVAAFTEKAKAKVEAAGGEVVQV